MGQTINYTVDLYRMINPSSVQDAGVQGDHRVTELKFNISSALWDWLTTKKGSGRLVYRFDGFDGSRGVHRSDIATLTSSTVTYQLENYLTRYGGLVEVQLVISVLGTNNSEVEFVKNELCSYTAKLRLAFSNFANNDNDAEFQSLSSLAAIAKSSAQVAQDKAKEAQEAQAKTEEAKRSLEDGNMVFILSGGGASTGFNPKFVIDDKMNEYSENLVPNKVIKEYIDKITHPVGSVWIGNKDDNGNLINPSEIFGGTWELFDKGFISKRIYLQESIKDAGLEANYFHSTGFLKITYLRIEYSAHEIFLSINAIVEKEIADGQVSLLHFDMNELGIKKVSSGASVLARYIAGLSDEGNTVDMLLLHQILNDENGETYLSLDCLDIVPEEQLSAGNKMAFSTGIYIPTSCMLDEFCDKFYWRRIK